jgi:hypothetical protein
VVETTPNRLPNAISTTGGIAAPLLAGFALTTVVQIVSAERPPRLANLAVASFTVAAALLLYALQFSGPRCGCVPHTASVPRSATTLG